MISLALAAVLAVQNPAETPLTLPSTPAPLHGTLLVPDRPRAAAVIIAGSGPTDRDGNSPLGVRAQPYRLLAEALAERGVAVVRYDKRGIAGSATAGGREEDLRFGALAHDARAWAAEAAERTGQPCAWLIGHSEGALVALDAARDDDKICGLVLISGAGRPAAAAIRDQLAPQLPAPMMAEADRALTDLAAGRTTASIPGLEVLFRPSVQPYLISWFTLDPGALIAAYDGPVMVVSGTRDLQLPASETDILTAAQPRARRLDIQDMNHVMKLAPADTAGNAATYADPVLPLAPGLADGVAAFILEPR